MIRAGVLGAMWLVACVSEQQVAAPDGSVGHHIECTSTEDCYEKAAEVCGGPYQIQDSGNRTASLENGGLFGASKWHELMVTCGGSSKPAVAAAAPAPKRPMDAASAPTKAAGFAFGDGLETAKAACENSSFEWTGSGTKYKCSGTPVDTGLGAQAKLLFCDGSLCRIDVVSRPPEGGSALAVRLEKIVGRLTERYGDPIRKDVQYPGQCAGAELPACLDEGIARFFYQWKWEGQKTLTLTLGAKKRQSDAEEGAPPIDKVAAETVRLRYDDGRFAAGPSHKAQNGDQGEQELGGL